LASLIMGTNSKRTLNLLSYFIQHNIPKGTIKAPTVDVLSLNNLRGTKTAFLTAKSYDKHPCPFYIGVLPMGILYTSIVTPKV